MSLHTTAIIVILKLVKGFTLDCWHSPTHTKYPPKSIYKPNTHLIFNTFHDLFLHNNNSAQDIFDDNEITPCNASTMITGFLLSFPWPNYSHNDDTLHTTAKQHKMTPA